MENIFKKPRIIAAMFVATIIILSSGCSNYYNDGFSTTGSLIVVNKLGNNVSIIDLSNTKNTFRVPVGKEPHEVVVSSDGLTAVISNYKDGTLSILDIPKKKVVRTILIDEKEQPHGLAFLDDENRILVTGQVKKNLYTINVLNGVVEDSIFIDEANHMVTLDKSRNLAFLGNIGSGTVSVVDLNTKKVLKSIKTGDGPEGMAITADNKKLWVANRGDNSLVSIDLQSFEIEQRIQSEKIPIRIISVPNEESMLITFPGSRLVKALNSQDFAELHSISYKKNFIVEFLSHSAIPNGLVLHPNNKHLFVSTSNGNSVSVIDIIDWKEIANLPTGKLPDGIAYSSFSF